MTALIVFSAFIIGCAGASFGHMILMIILSIGLWRAGYSTDHISEVETWWWRGPKRFTVPVTFIFMLTGGVITAKTFLFFVTSSQ